MFVIRFALRVIGTLFYVLFRRLFRGRLRPRWTWRHETLVRVIRRTLDGLDRYPIEALPRLRPHLRPPRKALPAGGGVRFERDYLGDLPVGWFHTLARDPEGSDGSVIPPTGPVILYLHGGAYILCSFEDSHFSLIVRLTRAARMLHMRSVQVRSAR